MKIIPVLDKLAVMEDLIREPHPLFINAITINTLQLRDHLDHTLIYNSLLWIIHENTISEFLILSQLK